MNITHSTVNQIIIKVHLNRLITLIDIRKVLSIFSNILLSISGTPFTASHMPRHMLFFSLIPPLCH